MKGWWKGGASRKITRERKSVAKEKRGRGVNNLRGSH